MISNSTIELQVTEGGYCSPGDEAAFYTWLGDLPCVKKLGGYSQTLCIDIDASAVDEECLRELLAIFKRYDISLKSLAIFDCEEFASWFRDDKKAYWHKEIFG